MSTEDIAAIGLALETDGVEKGIRALDVLASKGPAVEKSMGQVEGAAKRTGKSLEMLGQGGAASSLGKLGGAATTAARDISQIEGATSKAGRSLEGMGFSAQLAAKAVASIGIATAVRGYLQSADAITTLSNSLKLSTGSTQAASAAYGELYQIAQRSRVGFLQLGETYSSISRATGELGISQARMLKVTESIANAMTIGGGSAQGMNAALVQLSQGMSSGTLRGEELNSILEQAPRLAKALADGLGVPIGKLREMGQAGEITSQQIVKALEAQSSVLSKEVTGATITLSQAFTQLTNSGTKAVGEFDKASGASTSLAQAVSSIASAMDGLGTAFQNNETIIKTVMGSLAGAAALTTLAAVPRAIGAIGVAVTGLSAVLAANPIVLTLLGVGAVVGGGIAAVNAYKKTEDGIKASIRSLEAENARAEKSLAFTAGMGSSYQRGDDATRVKIEERTKAIRALNAELALMSSTGLDTSAEDARLAAGTEQMRAQQRAAEELSGIKQKLNGVDKDYLPTLNKLFAQYQAGAITLKEYQDLVSKLAQNNYKPEKQTAGLKQEQSAYESLIASIRAKIEADNLEIAGGAALTESQRIRIKLDQDLAAGRVKLSAQNERAVRLALEELKASEASALAAKTLAKANLDAAQSREKYITSLSTGLDKIQADIAAQIEATERMGLSKEAIADLDAAKLEMLATDLELQAVKALDRNLDQQTYDALKAQAQAYRELGIAKKGGAAKEAALDLEKANAEAAKKAQEDWERASEQINNTLTDALMRGFESGKGFAENLRQTVVNMFKTMVLRPVISAIINPISQGITGMMGLSGAAQAGQGASALGGIGNMASLASGIGSFTTAGMLPTGIATALTGSTSSLAMGLSGAWGAGGGMLSTLNAGASMLGSGSIMSGLGTLAGALGPIALGIAALAAIFGKKATPHAGAASTYSEAGGLVSNADIYRASGLADVRTYNAGVEQVTGNVAKAIGDTLNATAKAFGQTAGYEITTAFADDTSKDGAWGSLIIKQMGEAVIDWRDTQTSKWAPREFADGEAGSKEYLAEVAKSARDALVQAIGSVDWATGMLTGLGDTVSLESLAQTVQQINAAQAAFDALGKNIVGFGALTDGAISQLIKAAGSIDGLVSAASAYYDNFYSEAEKTANVTRDVAAALADVGLQMPTTREEFRALVESQMALGDAGTDAVAALLGVSGAFASVTAASETAADAAARLADEQGKAAEAAARAAEKAAEEAARAYEKGLERVTSALDRAMQVMSSSVEREMAAAQAAFDSRITVIDAQISAAQTAYQSQQSILSASLSSAKSMQAEMEGTVRSLRDALASLAPKGMEREFSVVASGGDLSKLTNDQLIGQTRGLDTSWFGSREEYLSAFFRGRSAVQERERMAVLSVGSAASLSAAKESQMRDLEEQYKLQAAGFEQDKEIAAAQLKATNDGFEGLLKAAQDQIAELNGTKIEVMSLGDSITNFASAIAAFARFTGATTTTVLPTVTSIIDGSHAGGLPYVPFNGYVAELHQGERVLTADEARVYQPMPAPVFQPAGPGNAELLAELRAVRARLEAIEAASRATAGHTAGTDRKLARVIKNDALATEVVTP